MTDSGKLEKIKRILDPHSGRKTLGAFKPPPAPSSPAERLKSFLKARGRLYSYLVQKLGPVFMHPMNRANIDRILNQHGEKEVIVNIGSGPSLWSGRPDIINIDIFPYAEVDILADDTLPLKSGCADLILCIAALEHIPEPRRTVAEMHRIAKAGGRALVFVPFMQPYHASPDDYGRWTESGLKNLLAPFEIDDIWIGGGPTSGMLWVVQEWLALFFSFGSERASELLLPVFMALTSPLKWIDLVLIRHPRANKIASGFYVLASKRAATDNSATAPRS
ncbi:MAG: class I SAM-dependent methyltransferase [Elusimicrobia bacterium]|nr:class I SAM-dependent methyltransferase [Elusimicrobiota bacterium]